MLSEIVFRQIERCKISGELRGELLPFITEIENKKTILQQDNGSYSFGRSYKKKNGFRISP